MIRELGRPGDLGWVVQAHGETYADEYGWDIGFEALVARIVADFAGDPTGRAWIAEVDGRRAGCVFLVAKDETTAQLRLLLTTPAGRGRGLGRLLVETCVAQARRAGFSRMVLWTNSPLTAARALYLDLGFVLTDEEPHHSFGVDLVGQNYELDL